MIFPKTFLAEAVSKKTSQAVHNAHPYETHYQNGDKSPAELISLNYITFFDLRSNELKDLVVQARRDIVNNCFKEENMGVFPNVDSIEDCIKRTNIKHYGKHLDRRNVYFGNSKKLEIEY